MGAVGDDFYSSVLNLIGAPVTPNTLTLCRTWQGYEGGSAAWNPWNTTQWAEGATTYNSAGVKNYPDEATGEMATANTVRNGYYPDVLAAFRADLPMNQWGNSAAIIAQINTWGTHGFAAYLQSIAKQSAKPTGDHDVFNTVVVHITDAGGGQLLVDSDGTSYGANGEYANPIPLSSDDFNKLVARRATAWNQLLAALQGSH